MFRFSLLLAFAPQIHGDGLIIGDWKLISWDYKNNEDGWFAPPGQNIATTPYLVHCNPNGAIPKNGTAPNPSHCLWPSYCLFNITADPCEYHDVSAANPDVVSTMQARLAEYQATAVLPITGEGCMPNVINITGPDGSLQAYQPCDA